MCPNPLPTRGPDPNDPNIIAARLSISVPHAIAFKLSIPVPPDLNYLEGLIFNSMMRTLFDLQGLGLKVKYFGRDPSVGRDFDTIAVSEPSAGEGIVLDTYAFPLEDADHRRASLLRRNYALRLGADQPLPPCVTAKPHKKR